MDLKTVAGWIKIIGYIIAIAGLAMSYLDPKTGLIVIATIATIVKLLEVIAPLTPTTVDDQILQAIKEDAAKAGLLK